MKLTRKKAIELCIESWTWLVETGREKDDWPEWQRHLDYCEPKGSSAMSGCWFCEYDMQRRHKSLKHRHSTCHFCPINSTDAGYDCLKMYYGKWETAKLPRTRKKYAKLFLAQIESLRT